MSACKFKLEVDGTSTPNDWTAVGTSDKVEAVEAIFDEKYIKGSGVFTQQWFTVENVASPPAEDVRRVDITYCFKRDDPNIAAGVMGIFAVGDATVGSNPEVARCDWSCVTESFTHDPNDATPLDWGDINNMRIGVMTYGTSFARVGRIYATVYCGTGYTPCPQCCCCCLCMVPQITIGAWSIGESLAGTGGLSVGANKYDVPFERLDGPTGGACYFTTGELNEFIGTNGIIDLYLLELSTEASITEGQDNPCQTVTAVYYTTLAGDPTPINQIVFQWQPDLKCCKPHHLSTADEPFGVTGGECGVSLPTCPSIRVECEGGGGVDSIGVDCQPL